MDKSQGASMIHYLKVFTLDAFDSTLVDNVFSTCKVIALSALQSGNLS